MLTQVVLQINLVSQAIGVWSDNWKKNPRLWPVKKVVFHRSQLTFPGIGLSMGTFLSRCSLLSRLRWSANGPRHPRNFTTLPMRPKPVPMPLKRLGIPKGQWLTKVTSSSVLFHKNPDTWQLVLSWKVLSNWYIIPVHRHQRSRARNVLIAKLPPRHWSQFIWWKVKNASNHQSVAQYPQVVESPAKDVSHAVFGVHSHLRWKPKR